MLGICQPFPSIIRHADNNSFALAIAVALEALSVVANLKFMVAGSRRAWRRPAYHATIAGRAASFSARAREPTLRKSCIVPQKGGVHDQKPPVGRFTIDAIPKVCGGGGLREPEQQTSSTNSSSFRIKPISAKYGGTGLSKGFLGFGATGKDAVATCLRRVTS